MQTNDAKLQPGEAKPTEVHSSQFIKKRANLTHLRKSLSLAGLKQSHDRDLHTAVDFESRLVHSNTLTITADDDNTNIGSVSADNSPTTTTVTSGSRRRRLWNSLRSWHRQRSYSRDREKSLKRGCRADDICVTSTSEPELALHSTAISDENWIQQFVESGTAQQLQQSQQSQQPTQSMTADNENSMAVDDNANTSSVLLGLTDIPAIVTSPITMTVMTSAVVADSATKLNETRLNNLRSQPFCLLEVILKEGRDLVIRDSCGTSDPYVLFKIGPKQFYRSRIVFKNLNPHWDERFTIPVEDPFKAIHVSVYDYDRGMNDDFMGMTSILPTQLDLSVPVELKLMLRENVPKAKNLEYMGYLIVQCTLVPKTQAEKDLYLGRMSKLMEQSKKLRLAQMWTSVVNIRLIHGRDLLSMDDNGYSDPYVKFRLGNERYKSRYKPKTLNPKWLEQFDLYMFDDQTSYLEVSVWDHDAGGRDDMMGRAEFDLSLLEPEKTHTIDLQLEDGAGCVRLLVTISGLAGYQSIDDLNQYEIDNYDHIAHQYSLVRSFSELKDVGWLRVKVLKAQGVMAADIGGKSDPFCVLELINARLQTRTEYKTLSPEWNKEFVFAVSDIHSVLEISVYDEDRDKRSDFLGKIAIPLLKIRNGQKCWYQLKDRKLMTRMKGAIQLEMTLVYNKIKAAIRTFNPKEDKYLQLEHKFRVAVMKHNIERVKSMVQSFVAFSHFMNSCFTWQNKFRTILAFMVFILIVWNFELYMLPLMLLFIFIKNLLFLRVGESLLKDDDVGEYLDVETCDFDHEPENSKEAKKSFKEKLVAIQDACLQVQEIMDRIACVGERLRNSVQWTVPWLSWLAVIVLTVVSVILYFVPLRYVVLAWGINKFTKKLRAPNSLPNNELLDYLSRVPSDKELVEQRELRPDPSAVTPRKKQQ